MTTTQLLLDSKMVIKSDFFNQSPISAFIWNNDDAWSVKEVSKNITKLLGYTTDDFINGKIIYSELIHDDDIQRVKKEVSHASTSKKLDLEHSAYRIRNKNGKYIWVEDRTSIIYDNDKITHYVGYISDCTKEVESLQELKDSRQMWIHAIENNGDGLWEWNILTNEVYFSTQWKKMLGFEEHEISNNVSEWEKRVHPKDKDRVEKELEDYISGKRDRYISEHRVLCKDGTYKWVLDRGSITKYSEDGNAEIITGTHLDVSEKKEVEKKLAKNTSYSRVLIDNLPFLVWLKDKNGRFLKVNQPFANASNFTDPKLLINKNDFDIWPMDLAWEYVKDDEKVLSSGKSKQVKENIIIEGRERCFETFKAPVYDQNKRLLGSIGYSQDISEQIKIEEKLKSQNEEIELERLKLSTIIQFLPDPLWIKDKNGVYLACNKRFENLFGLRDEEIIGKTDYDFTTKKIADAFRKKDLAAINSNDSISDLDEMVFSDGHKEYLHTTKTKVVSTDGNLYGVLGISRDVSELKQYQDDLIKQKEEFETIFNNSTDGIAVLDLSSNILNCNEAYREMLDYSKEELLTKSCMELIIPEEKESSYMIFQEVIEKGFVKNFEKRCFTKNKKIIYVNMSASVLPDKKRLLLISRDVSHVKLLEEQSRLIAMGEMIGNIAHQWRQPLSIISTASTGLKLQKEFGNLSDKELVETCNIINEHAQYLSSTIEDFRNFIKDNKSLGIVSIKDAMEYTLHLTEATMKNNFIKVILKLDDDLKIHANKNELVQSFMNILNNAKDILKEKKESERYIIITTTKVEETLKLTIFDNGGGISKNIISRIFEPYFTTKHQSMGTGIGLSMVSKILRDRYEADVDVYNDSQVYENKNLYGACFTIIFKANAENLLK